MTSLSREAKIMRDIIYRRRHLEHANNLVSWIFWMTFRHEIQAFCNIQLTFYYQFSAANVFMSVLQAVSEPPVPKHVQRKEHVFQVLTLE